MRSMTVFASAVIGIVVGSSTSPCPAHSDAMARAKDSLRTVRTAPAGVRTGRPSSNTRKPPSPEAAVASL